MRFEIIFGIQKAEHQQRMVLRTMRVQDLKAADQGESDEGDEDLQAGPSLCWPPESHLHPQPGLQGARAAHVAGRGRGPHICLSGLLCREGLQMKYFSEFKDFVFSG